LINHLLLKLINYNSAGSSKIEEPKSKFIQKERGYGEVHQTILLPSIIDADKSIANYKNNILTMEKYVTKITIQ
jgi:HSP20 family molecular chaperone IbpA